MMLIGLFECTTVVHSGHDPALANQSIALTPPGLSTCLRECHVIEVGVNRLLFWYFSARAQVGNTVLPLKSTGWWDMNLKIETY